MSTNAPRTASSPASGNGQEPCGAVLVCGGGVAGIQASLDLSAAGFRVYLVEESPTIGGSMARLDKTFPTGDCATCIISPKLVECIRDLNVDVLTMADVVELDGEPGRFKAKVRQRPRGVDAARCTGCGDCWNACPVRNVPESPQRFVPGEQLPPEEAQWLDDLLARYADDPAPLIPLLQDINDDRGYLSRAMLERLAVCLEIPLAEILRVASFYNALSLEPVGRHVIEVCLGTACFVRGSGTLLERLEQQTGVAAGGTDEAMRFTLRTVRCIGCCALAPAMRIDGVTFAKVKLDKVPDILERFA
ncbi:MAG TPA: NAD(P)H-dependent oxidoreductase subunit E [Thermoguttaceae bacterium]|nr:NAD(P)H-dependent oxidoreductase subunit E [Thermoguttaceae bacterium]